jgi:L-fuculose-phosphate aldolase
MRTTLPQVTRPNSPGACFRHVGLGSWPEAENMEAGMTDGHPGTEGGDLAAERNMLIAYGRRMVADGLVDGMSGNLSVRAAGLVAITPSGIGYDQIDPADICLVRLPDGSTDSPRRPSTETPMHLAIYQATGAGAVVHTHSPFVVALSAILDVLPAVHYAMADLGGPVRVSPYARFGTGQLARNAVAALAGRTAVILQNHGALTYGSTLTQAYDRARTLEWLARTYWHARMAAGGGPLRLLDQAALDEVHAATRAIGYGEPQPPL